MRHTFPNRPARNTVRLALEPLEDRTVPSPVVLDQNLEVRTVATFLPNTQPTTMAFLRQDSANDFLVTEKNTGIVQRVRDGVSTPVLDLPVNFAGERGLLGMALHPDFFDTDVHQHGRGRGLGHLRNDHKGHDDDGRQFVYLYWTESSTGADTNVAANTPLLGNRVDRFVWDGSKLTMDRNIIRLRALQPANPPFETNQFTNHNGGVIRFGPDGNLYVFIGDNGRRGNLQNILQGHGQNGMDDQFGGPAADNAHLTGVILRLDENGEAPKDNPFFKAGKKIAKDNPEVGANIQKVFSYGHRNSFGFAFDPFTDRLWLEENGDDSFTELNLVEPGMNGGWIQVAGPLSRVAEFRQIETGNAPGFPPGMFRGLQQTRFSPDELPSTPAEALARMFQLPGSHYSDPEFSWKFEVAPAGVGFLSGDELGQRYVGDLFVGAARVNLAGGQIWRFDLNAARTGFSFTDPRLADGVADNRFKFDIQESDSLLFGFNFGIATSITEGPDGHLYVVSLSDGAVYEIRPKAVPPTGTFFTAIMTNDQEVPPAGVTINTPALGIALFQLSTDQTRLEYTVHLFNLDLNGTRTPTNPNDDVRGLHIHRAPAGQNGSIVFGMIGPDTDLDGPVIDPVANTVTGDWDLTEGNGGATLATELQNLLNDGLYINSHTSPFPSGEIRGQIRRWV